MTVPAYIPSPSSNGIHLGPFFFHAYGIAYVFAVLAAILITRKRTGQPDLVNEVALWGFPAGLIGGRLYFIITTPGEVPDHWWGPFAIWQGGLGIWGGIACGTLAGLWVLRRRKADIPRFLDAAAPALLVAQAIGRIGNYFNQELFGGPTTLPWGLKIDLAHRPVGYAAVRDVPADVPLRDHLEPVAGRIPGVARADAQDPAAGLVCALCRRLLRLSHLRGDAADRHVQPRARTAAQLLRRHRSVHRRPVVVRRDSARMALPAHRRLARACLGRCLGRGLRLSRAGRSPRAWQPRWPPSAADRR